MHSWRSRKLSWNGRSPGPRTISWRSLLTRTKSVLGFDEGQVAPGSWHHLLARAVGTEGAILVTWDECEFPRSNPRSVGLWSHEPSMSRFTWMAGPTTSTPVRRSMGARDSSSTMQG